MVPTQVFSPYVLKAEDDGLSIYRDGTSSLPPRLAAGLDSMT